MRILVSARLQAPAAPEAPEPMIRTSTLSLICRASFRRRRPALGSRRADEARRIAEALDHHVSQVLVLMRDAGARAHRVAVGALGGGRFLAGHELPRRGEHELAEMQE